MTRCLPPAPLSQAVWRSLQPQLTAHTPTHTPMHHMHVWRGGGKGHLAPVEVGRRCTHATGPTTPEVAKNQTSRDAWLTRENTMCGVGEDRQQATQGRSQPNFTRRVAHTDASTCGVGGGRQQAKAAQTSTRKWVRRLPLMSAILAPHPACVWLPNAEPFSNAHAYTHGGRTRVGFYWPSPGLQPCRAGNNPHTRAYAVGCLSVVITRGAWYRPGWFDHESGPPTVQCGSLTHRHLPAAVFHTHIHAHGDAAHTAHSQVGATAASGLVLRCVVGALLA